MHRADNSYYTRYMCANYVPSTPAHLRGYFGVAPPDVDYKAEAYPGNMAPIIRKPRADAGYGERSAALAMFGMVPHWAETKLARQTYNARSETVAQKPSFRNAFKRAQFCIVPAEVIFEPSYESGKAERFAIWQRDAEPLGIAGIWEYKADHASGMPLLSFSMLTINADAHPLMQRFHKPEDEKRMLVFLRAEQFDDWLHCTAIDAHAMLIARPAEDLVATSAPKVTAVKSDGAH